MGEVEQLTDLILISSDGQKFHTCRYIMYNVSGKFQGMFNFNKPNFLLPGEKETHVVNCSAPTLKCLVDYALNRCLVIPENVMELYNIANEYLFTKIIQKIIAELIIQYPKMAISDKIKVINAAVLHKHTGMLKLIEPWMSDTTDAAAIVAITDILASIAADVKRYKELLNLIPLFGNKAYHIDLERIIAMAMYHNITEFWVLTDAHKNPRSTDFWVLEALVFNKCTKDKAIPQNTHASICFAMKSIINWPILKLKFE